MVPLSDALAAFMKDHNNRFPNAWDELYPYLERACSDTGFYAPWVRESHEIAWGVDPIALFRPGSCAQGGRPIVVSRRNDKDVPLPWCFDETTRLARILIRQGVIRPPPAPTP